MTDARMPTGLWVQAHLARLSSKGIPVVLVKRGDLNSGIVIVKVNRIEGGIDIFMQGRDAAGNFSWQPGIDGRRVDDLEADAFIKRQTAYDPDIWVIEIEDCEGCNPIEILDM